MDRNRLQQGDPTESIISLEPLVQGWSAFGWAVKEADGHDSVALCDVFCSVPFVPGKPSYVIANSVKGQGGAFMENRAEWHQHVPHAELQSALAELGEATR